MYNELMCHKNIFIREYFVGQLDLNTINLRYIDELDMSNLNIDVFKMGEIGGDSLAHFFGYKNLTVMYKALQIEDQNNPNYAINLKTADIFMTESFLHFCKHIKTAIINDIIKLPTE
jgi:hypothetical protein